MGMAEKCFNHQFDSKPELIIFHITFLKIFGFAFKKN